MTGRITRARMWGATAGFLIGAASLAWSPAAWGQGASPAPLQVQEAPFRSMDRSLEGMRQGLLTRANNGVISIDRSTYTLAAGALIETKSGKPLSANMLKLEDVHYPVTYWLGTDSTDKQITQLIIYFPE